MTNTPMTFEEWFAQHDTLAEYSAKQAWQASQAQQASELESLKLDIESYIKISSEQSQTIVELVEAIDNFRKVKGRHNTEIACNRLYALADKVKGK